MKTLKCFDCLSYSFLQNRMRLEVDSNCFDKNTIETETFHHPNALFN